MDGRTGMAKPLRGAELGTLNLKLGTQNPCGAAPFFEPTQAGLLRELMADSLNMQTTTSALGRGTLAAAFGAHEMEEVSGCDGHRLVQFTEGEHG